MDWTGSAVPEVRGRIVTTPDGRLLRRVGGDTQPLRGDAMARFVREREHRAGEDQPPVMAQTSAFDPGASNQALAADGRPPVRQDRMDREMESRLMEPPIFEATSSSVTVTGKRVPGRRHRSIARLTPPSPMATKVNLPSVTLISSGARPARVRRTQVSTWTVIEVRPMRSVRQWQLTRSPT